MKSIRPIALLLCAVMALSAIAGCTTEPDVTDTLPSTGGTDITTEPIDDPATTTDAPGTDPGTVTSPADTTAYTIPD